MKSKSRFTTHEQIVRIAIVGMLIALGYLLMLFGKIQGYPFAPFLEIEISDTIVLVAYSLYGFWASLFVSFGKTLLHLLTFGPVGTPIPIGNITALFTSVLYSLCLLVLDKGLKIFSKNRWMRYLGYVLIVLVVSSVMTFLNYLFITPTFLVYGATFFTFKDIEGALLGVFENLEKNLKDAVTTFHELFGNASFGIAIFTIYFPFNLIKGSLVCLFYELIFNRVIFHMLKNGRFKSKVFLKKSEVVDEKNEETEN